MCTLSNTPLERKISMKKKLSVIRTTTPKWSDMKHLCSTWRFNERLLKLTFEIMMWVMSPQILKFCKWKIKTIRISMLPEECYLCPVEDLYIYMPGLFRKTGLFTWKEPNVPLIPFMIFLLSFTGNFLSEFLAAVRAL